MANPVHTLELPLPKVASGKVREIYDAGDDTLLLVTSDRLSAFDVILQQPIPNKGAVLNQMSLFWFDHFGSSVKNAVIESDPTKMTALSGLNDEQLEALKGRSVLMRKAKPFPVECIVRGWLIGSGYKDYLKTGKVCGIQLPEGLRKADRLPEPIFTPSTKAVEGHDENISFEQVVELIGEDHASQLRDLSLLIYTKAAEYARDNGIIIADTKFEFGLLDSEIVLIDEVLTPDSSRFWPANDVVPGENPPSFDKQIVRDWLEASGWGKEPPAPMLPQDIVDKTSEAYLNIFQKLAKRDLDA
ncbi:MAG TPA: phosphoribosylaminoimidazolesuccinocarboxamide synthase [Bacteroidetes bacterium]|nr:phosphoribosylaminoimidazole-succinocarboxamide synthase [bacterium BMS3Bbin04]HDO64811.1 phosphoribosylaminoimidazolesuccinocarboxamide synthase [Bacteroidota bacterium]HEX03936.1 phosphoribosylaminoimidazolesuccinocarboxamide synthase [Bacteroidota bacterium]